MSTIVNVALSENKNNYLADFADSKHLWGFYDRDVHRILPSPPSTKEMQHMSASDYLRLLDPTTENFLFAAFDYRKERKPKLQYGSLDKLNSKLQALNDDVFCIYVTINETEGWSRKKQDITRCRAVWIEDDVPVNEPRTDFPIPASMVVESSPGKYHYYWLTSTTEFEQWDAVMQTMVDVWGCDFKARDISRVLRVPGFVHRKNLDKKFTARLVSHDGALYSWQKILEAFPPAVPDTVDGELDTPAGLYKEGEAIAAILNSTNYHGSLTSVAMSLSNHGMSREMQLYTLRGLMLSIPKENRREEWDARISDEHLYECIDSGLRKIKDEHVNIETLTQEPRPSVEDKEIEFPPGDLGVLCQEILEMAPYENRAIALAGGMGIAAGIVGRCYNVLGMGLNIYVALLADSGIGKANLKDSINLALRGRGGLTNPGASFIGRSRFTGPKPIFDMLSKGLSKICVLEESGLMAESKAGDQSGISRVTLDLFTSSGYGKWAGDEGYSKVDDSIPILPSPALSLIHVSTPKSFLKALRSKSAEVSGEVARLWMIRTIGEKPYLNRKRRSEFSELITDRIESLVVLAAQYQSVECRERPRDMAIKPEFITEADHWTDLENRFLREGDHLRRTMCSRAWAKIIKLAAVASAFNGHDEICDAEYKWATHVVKHELEFIQDTFSHESSSDIMELAKSIVSPCILKCLKSEYNTTAKTPALNLRKKGIFTHSNISQIMCNNVVIRSLDDDPEKQNPKTGIEKVMDYMLRAGMLTQVTESELRMLKCKSPRAYKVTADFEVLFD